MKQRLLILFTCVVLFINILSTFSLDVSAKSNLTVKVHSGLDNKAKETKGLPVLLTITNKGDAFSGEIVIDNEHVYSGGMGIVTPLEIGSNETKSIKIMLDYFSNQYSNNLGKNQMIHIYEGNWKTGKEIRFTGDEEINPRVYDRSNNFILTFTNSTDRLSALSSTSSTDSTEIIHLGGLKQDIIPTTAKGWSMANIVVVDEYSISSLKEEEQQSLLEWVKLGGTLLIGASDNLDGEIGIFKDFLPLFLSDETVKTQSKDIQKKFKDVKLSNEIVSYKAKKADAEVKTILELNNHILAAKSGLGDGQIIQTAFSLGDEPLSTEKNYGELLQRIIPFNAISNINANYQFANFTEGNTSVNEMFPTFQVSTLLLIIIIAIYIIVVGPLLYFLLKRKDKREYAWWIIPALSLFISILVFGYGAKDRLSKPQIQQSAVYKIDGDDSLNGYYMNSLLTNSSGDFTFTTPTNSTSTLIRNFNNGGTIHKQGILEHYQKESKITVLNNRYWSVSTIAGEMQMRNVGSFDIDIEVEDSAIKGTVKNNLPYTVKDLSIWYGSQWLKLGSIKPEQTLKITQTFNGALLLPAMPIYSNYPNQVKNQEDIMNGRKEMLKNAAYDLIVGKEQPALVGWVDDAITPISLKDSKADMSNVNLLVQSFNPKTNLTGEFVLPANSMTYDIIPTSNSSMADRPENSSSWYIEEGTYDFDWVIPEMLQDKKFKWTELQLANTDPKNVQLQILNVKTSSFEAINDGRFTITKNVKDYISDEGLIKFKLDRKMSDDQHTNIPTLQLKGEVKQ